MKLLRTIWQHPWTVAACNFLLMMAIYSLMRLFFYGVNQDLFPDVTPAHLLRLCLGGMRFDLTALLYLNSLYLLLMLLPFPQRANPHYSSVTRWLFWIPNIIGILINAMDTVYVRFTDRRTTCTVFSEFQHDDNLGNIFVQSIVQYWYVTLFCLAMIALLILLTRKHCVIVVPKRKVLYYVRETVILLVSVYFIVIGIRGGFGAYTRPITISNSLQYTNKPTETAIVLNTPFSLMKSLENTTYQDPRYMSNAEMATTFSPLHEADTTRAFVAKNVVIIILESFSKEYIGFYNHHLDNGTYTGYTPFLDSLLQHSQTYTLSLASGRKSIDAMPSTLSSIPMLIEPFVVTPYSTNAISSIADCLRGKGYTTAFYHGAPNGSMGFQAFARSAGFEAYYGMDEYDGPAAFDGTWAIWDEEFLQYYLRSMNQLPEPFCTAVFTASSHHPFRVPARYEGLFPAGTHPLHACVGYTDYALQQFFAEAKKQPWYANTLFVLTADHTNQLTYPEYTTAKGLFEVPIAFFAPDNSLAGVSPIPASQTDIMPSVLAYLGYDKPYFAFGKDILMSDSVAAPYVINYSDPVYQIFSDHLLLQFDGQQTTALYDFVQDPLLQTNLVADLPHTPAAQRMEHYLQAYIQQYLQRMINNQMTY